MLSPLLARSTHSPALYSPIAACGNALWSTELCRGWWHRGICSALCTGRAGWVQPPFSAGRDQVGFLCACRKHQLRWRCLCFRIARKIIPVPARILGMVSSVRLSDLDGISPGNSIFENFEEHCSTNTWMPQSAARWRANIGLSLPPTTAAGSARSRGSCLIYSSPAWLWREKP